MRCTRLAVRGLLLGLVASAVGCLSPRLERETWIEVSTPNFAALSNDTPARTRQLLQDLELYRVITLQLTGAKQRPSPVPTNLYIFRNDRTFAPFATDRDLLGYMYPGLRENRIVVNAGTRELENPNRVVFHEYVHFLLRNLGGFQFPAWFDEGFAEFLSTVEIEPDRITFGRAPQGRYDDLLLGQQLGLRLGPATVLRARSAADFRDREAALFYAESWLLTHFFYAAHASDARFPNRAAQLSKYLALLDQGRSADEAASMAFGLSLSELATDVSAYMAAGRFAYLQFGRDAFPQSPEAEVRSVPTWDATTRLGVCLAQGSERERALARRLFEYSIEQNPRHAAAYAGMARGYRGDEAIPWLERAVELEPAEPRWMAQLGEALVDAAFARASQQGDEVVLTPEGNALLDRGREVLRTSIELAPDAPYTLFVYGTSFIFESDVKPGIDALERVRSLVPGDIGNLVRLGAMYASQGDRERAIPLLRRVQAFSHGGPDLEAARQLLAALRGGPGSQVGAAAPAR